jgi:Flp pilus assembly protein TadD
MNLAGALLESGAYHEAIGELKILDEHSPPTIRNRCMLGALYEKTGDTANASVYYGRAMLIDVGKAKDECLAIRGVLGLR